VTKGSSDPLHCYVCYRHSVWTEKSYKINNKKRKIREENQEREREKKLGEEKLEAKEITKNENRNRRGEI
jgi:hypothetical protein